LDVKTQLFRFITEGDKGPVIDYINRFISTITPHSIENERGFCQLKNIFTNYRGKLSDTSLKSLYFLKYFYKNEKEIERGLAK
jgi:hypothetical protein